jgi:hypothetical protein
MRQTRSKVRRLTKVPGLRPDSRFSRPLARLGNDRADSANLHGNQTRPFRNQHKFAGHPGAFAGQVQD